MKKTFISILAALSLTVSAYAQNIAGGTVTVLQGGSTTANGATVGLVDVSSNASGTTQSMFYTLNSVTVAASAFNAATRGIVCDGWGITAANANNKDIKVTLGSATLVTLTGQTASGKAYNTHLSCVRTNTNTQSCAATLQVDTATAVGMAQTTAPGQTEASPIIVAVQSQNTAAAAASATGDGMACVFIN